jgi:DNA repair protein RecN (Recombination protein N)
VSLLQYLADDLVAVHGQADQQQLLKPGRQREALDRYAGAELSAVLVDYQRAYNEHRKVRERLASLRSEAATRAAETESLRRGSDEIEKVDPGPDEDVTLRADEERLANADTLHAAATTAHEALLGDPTSSAVDAADAITLLGHARSSLEGVRSYDAALAVLADRLSEAVYLVSDTATEIASYVQSIDADPERLAQVQERRATLNRLVRTYGTGVLPGGATLPVPGGDITAVIEWGKAAAARLAELDSSDETIAALVDQEASLSARVAELATRLHELRAAAAEKFAADVSDELTALAMPHAKITAVLASLPEPGPHGIDDVEIRLAPHPGAPALPLHKGASGGELSRVMLAIEVVFAGADPVPTFVFDEVDAGVGGKAAVEIGRRLARLARQAQVIVVTHLPQVAAFADNHLVVAKADDGRITSSGVLRLGHADRVRELSRMLAGLEDSEFGRAHAAELLDLAASDRA